TASAGFTRATWRVSAPSLAYLLTTSTASDEKSCHLPFSLNCHMVVTSPSISTKLSGFGSPCRGHFAFIHISSTCALGVYSTKCRSVRFIAYSSSKRIASFFALASASRYLSIDSLSFIGLGSVSGTSGHPFGLCIGTPSGEIHIVVFFIGLKLSVIYIARISFPDFQSGQDLSHSPINLNQIRELQYVIIHYPSEYREFSFRVCYNVSAASDIVEPVSVW